MKAKELEQSLKELTDTNARSADESPPFMTFRRQDRVVGALDFDGHKLVFTGDADESAKSLFDALAIDWDRRLAEAVNAEREACAKVCEDEQFELAKYIAGRNVLQHFNSGCRSCADAIRARGET